jgi:hypothetical protein
MERMIPKKKRGCVIGKSRQMSEGEEGEGGLDKVMSGRDG